MLIFYINDLIFLILLILALIIENLTLCQVINFKKMLSASFQLIFDLIIFSPCLPVIYYLSSAKFMTYFNQLRKILQFNFSFLDCLNLNFVDLPFLYVILTKTTQQQKNHYLKSLIFVDGKINLVAQCYSNYLSLDLFMFLVTLKYQFLNLYLRLNCLRIAKYFCFKIIFCPDSFNSFLDN